MCNLGVSVRRSYTINADLTMAVIFALQSMRGQKVVVELKNDVEISGVLEETDRNMK